PQCISVAHIGTADHIDQAGGQPVKLDHAASDMPLDCGQRLPERGNLHVASVGCRPLYTGQRLINRGKIKGHGLKSCHNIGQIKSLDCKVVARLLSEEQPLSTGFFEPQTMYADSFSFFLPATIKAIPQEGQRRKISVQSSSEDVDSEGDLVLQSALLNSTDTFLETGF